MLDNSSTVAICDHMMLGDMNRRDTTSCITTSAFRNKLFLFIVQLVVCFQALQGFRLQGPQLQTGQKVVSVSHPPLNRCRSSTTGIAPRQYKHQHQLHTNKLLLPQVSHVITRHDCSAFDTISVGIGTDPSSSSSSSRSSSHLLPQHKELVTGKLRNGLEYFILPNAVPGQRFEAHLEVLSGSVFEQEHQQGMAHLAEHVTYMGSPKRQLIAGTGSRTNAYTDFHHTVFFCGCPVESPDSPFWSKPMLPMAFDALIDVMSTKVVRQRR